MRYLREVTLTFESNIAGSVEYITSMIDTIVAERLSRYNIKVKVTKEGFYQDEKEKS